MNRHAQFDLTEARARRDEGLKQVAENNQRFLEAARVAARVYAERYGTVTMDDVRRFCPYEPLHPNAWGAVFRKGFVPTGEFVQSKAVSRRGGMQRVWRLK